MNRPPSIFITGTDTGVGKTVISAILAHIYSKAGIRTGLEKPVMTGVDANRRFDHGSDLYFLRRAVKTELPPVNSYSFSEPVSPHLAAAVSGSNIKIDKILADHQELMRQAEAVIVEGAGGLLAPLNDELFMADLIKALKLPAIVVSRPSLGTINHTLLSLEYARAKGIPVIGVIINKYPRVPNLSEADNPSAIERFGKIPVLAVVAEIEGLSVEEGTYGTLAEAAERLEARFRVLERLCSWRRDNG